MVESVSILKSLEPIGLIFAQNEEQERPQRNIQKENSDNLDLDCLINGLELIIDGHRFRLKSEAWTDYEMDISISFHAKLMKIYCIRDISMVNMSFEEFAGECFALGLYAELEEKNEGLSAYE